MTTNTIPVSVEEVVCGFCASPKYILLCPAPTSMIYADCAIVKCLNCGLVRTSPRPIQTTLLENYSDDYFAYQTPDLSGIGTKVKAFALKYNLNFLWGRAIPLPIPQNAVVCDVGCGSGRWLATLHLARPDLTMYGFEVDAKVAQAAAKNLNVEVKHGDFLKNNWPSASFDFITFWDVLEHLPEPNLVMKEVARLLKPGGSVVVYAPNINSIQFKLFKQFWWPLLFDQHIYHYNKQTLTQLFDAHKLKTVYFSKPLMPPTPHVVVWSMDQMRNELKAKNLTHTLKYKILNGLMQITSVVGKIFPFAYPPIRIFMCARKEA